MNKHIELVEKWLADKDSVSLEELKANRDAANAADAAYCAADAAYCASAAAYYAANAASASADAAYCVDKYKELTKEGV